MRIEKLVQRRNLQQMFMPLWHALSVGTFLALSGPKLLQRGCGMTRDCAYAPRSLQTFTASDRNANSESST